MDSIYKAGVGAAGGAERFHSPGKPVVPSAGPEPRRSRRAAQGSLPGDPQPRGEFAAERCEMAAA